MLRYGIPDFKLAKSHIDRRAKQLEAEGVEIHTGVLVGNWPKETKNDGKVDNSSTAKVSAKELLQKYDAILLAGGSEVSRDLPIAGQCQR